MAFLDAFASRNSGYQSVTIPTERSEGGSQSNAPLPVAGGGALLCVLRSVNDAGVRTKEITGHRKRYDGYVREAPPYSNNIIATVSRAVNNVAHHTLICYNVLEEVIGLEYLEEVFIMGKKKRHFEDDITPAVSAEGNPMPLAATSFFAAAIFMTIGLLLLFGDVNITSSGLVESPTANKVIAFIIMLLISIFFLAVGFGCLKKVRKRNKIKKQLK